MNLLTMRFVEEEANVLLIGPAGVGMTLLALCFGHAAVGAGDRTYYIRTADLAARCHRAALKGPWATTMRFLTGPRLLSRCQAVRVEGHRRVLAHDDAGVRVDDLLGRARAAAKPPTGNPAQYGLMRLPGA